MSQGVCCIRCGSDKTSVKDSRPTKSKTGIPVVRRRRVCDACSTRFTTLESPVEAREYLFDEFARIRRALMSAVADIDRLLADMQTTMPLQRSEVTQADGVRQ